MIQQIIGTVVNGLEIEGLSVAPNFIHGHNGWNNLAVDELEVSTVILLVEPLTSQDIMVGSLIQENYPLLMAFLEKAKIDDTPSDSLVHTDRMRRLKNKFMYNLINNPLVLNVENITTKDVFKEKDGCLTGVSVQFNVTPLNSSPVC